MNKVTQNDTTRTPQAVEGVDMKSLPIGPEEAFVLSRVDGRTNESEIAAVTGLDLDRVQTLLTRLSELGAVSFDAPPPPPKRPKPSPSIPPGRGLTHPVIEARDGGSSALHPAAALYDPAELDEEVDLELPKKRMILDRFYSLDSVTHYELLGVTADADKKAVKHAYFALVGEFHTDRYYGKNLGNFKAKLDRVFQRLTEAHDTLTYPATRSEYDDYLSAQSRTRDLEQALGDEPSRTAEVEQARKVIEEEARVAERAQHTPGKDSVRPLAKGERRRALARKLGATGMQARARSSAPPASSRSPVAQEMVADGLKRRYEQRLASARESQIEKYRTAAEQALAKNDVVAAASSLRIASSLVPEDEELADQLEEIQEKANLELAESYLEQARYEERSGRFLEAALSFERAARGKPSAKLYERAAHCLLEGDGDMRRAGELAKKAATMAPKAAEPRVTLAKVYAHAGMKESAVMEFERAAQLAPDDDSIKDWIKRLKRGEL